MRVAWHPERPEVEVEQLFGPTVTEELQEPPGEQVREVLALREKLTDLAQDELQERPSEE